MIVIVMGMHRSGTSALAGMLHQNGIFMGEDQNFLPPASAENQKGFFENYRFRALNDQILYQNGYSAKSFSPMTPDVIDATEQNASIMRSLLHEYDERYTTWGFKDPRMCLTYSAWKPFLQKPYTDQEIKIVIIYRPFEDIADSMIRRGNQGKKSKFIALSKEYYRKALKDVEQFSAVIKFENLINHTQAVADFLSERLGWTITDTSFIDKKISKGI